MEKDTNNIGFVEDAEISQVVKKSFIDYSMTVIAGRALPDVRDGLKPVHKRILYSMAESGTTPDKPYKKCARVVGDVMGKYHPHGDSSIYDALVRMAQKFSIRYPLIEGQGNFGSIDGDGAAAQRYTECRLQKIAMEMVRDINKDTVDFHPNYDGSEKEPAVLPSRYPNLLVNGSSGIAVGMATNIPPHNLGETIDGCVAMIDNPEISVLELMQYIKGPDFPLGATIYGTGGIREAYETGRGKIIVRAKAEIIEHKGRQRIEVTEIPYLVNKAKLVEYIADLVKEKRITGISDINDLSDRNGLKISIDIKRDANPNVVLNQLYKMSKMQETFGVIMLALVDMKPRLLNLREMIYYYLEHQKEVVTRRTAYDLKKAEERAHILEGLLKALDFIDEVIRIIRSSETSEKARTTLMDRFELSDVQATAILDMRLRRLAQLERNKIEEEYQNLLDLMERLKEILSDTSQLLGVIREELLEIKERFNTPRLTYIEKQAYEIDYEDLIKEENVVITLTESGYIKRINEDNYSSQRRGGKGIQAMNVKEDDIITSVFVTSTHRNLLFFSSKGKVYTLKAYEIPDAGRNAKGMNLVNLLPLENGERIMTVLSVGGMEGGKYLLMGTKKGIIKKTSVKEYANIRKNGLIAIGLRDGDELLHVKLTRGDADIVFVTKNGYAIVFNEKNVRSMGRTASGVKAITLRGEDECVSVDIAVKEQDLLVVSENGIGKRTPVSEFTSQMRGGMGKKAYRVTKKSGPVAASRVTSPDDEIMLVNSDGVAIRIKASDISESSRNTTGVILMKNSGDAKVIAMAKIKKSISDDETEIETIDRESDIEIDEPVSPEEIETPENVVIVDNTESEEDLAEDMDFIEKNPENEDEMDTEK